MPMPSQQAANRRPLWPFRYPKTNKKSDSGKNVSFAMSKMKVHPAMCMKTKGRENSNGHYHIRAGGVSVSTNPFPDLAPVSRVPYPVPGSTKMKVHPAMCMKTKVNDKMSDVIFGYKCAVGGRFYKKFRVLEVHFVLGGPFRDVPGEISLVQCQP